MLEPILALLPRLKRRSKRERLDEGLLAPRTPVRGSPLHTPVRMGSFGPGSSSGSYFPWGQDEQGNGQGQGQGTSSSSVYGANNSAGGARPRTPSSSTFASPEKKGTTYGALALDIAADNLNPASASASGSSSGASLSAPGPSHPPPRRVQSEAQVPGTGGRNPRGIATRNGRPALEDPSAAAAGGEGRKSDVLPPMSRPTSPGQSDGNGNSGKGKGRSPPRVSLGPQGTQRLEGVEIVESQGLTKKKAD